MTPSTITFPRKALHFLAVLFVFLSPSCSKRGCLDGDADNFEPKATIDCGCCVYAAKGIAWYRKPFYETAKAKNTSALKFSVNGQEVGATPSFRYFTDSPPTLATNSTSYMFYQNDRENVSLVSLGGAKKKTVRIKCYNQSNVLLWEGEVELSANKVTAFEMY